VKKIELFVHELEILSDNNAKVNSSLLHKTLDIIYKLFSLIRKCDTREEADKYFFLLGKIQLYLARLTFIYNIDLSQELMKIVRDCERIDDNNVRDFLFNEIKHDRYDLKSNSFLWYE
jgi:hypothetical protein